MTTTLAGIPRIETIGAVVRGKYGHLSRITEVLEYSRCSEQHISAPLDVVVRTEPVGVGFNHKSSWASDLTLAQEGDVGAHPHMRDNCECGQPYDETRSGLWYYVPANWETS
jgi:hypothetical protein